MSSSPNMPESPNLPRKNSSLGNQNFLNEVEEKLKSMRQRRLNRLNAFVDEQSKLSEERTKTKQDDPVSTHQETLLPEKRVATVRSRPSFRAASEKIVDEKTVKSAPVVKSEVNESEMKTEETKEESKKLSSTKKLISKFNCVGTSDLTDEPSSRNAAYTPSNKYNTFTVENKKLTDTSAKFLQRNTISFPDDFSVELQNKSQLMKNKIYYKSIEALNTEDKQQSENKIIHRSAETLLHNNQLTKPVKIVPTNITETEHSKLVKLEPPKLTKIEPPKVEIPTKLELSKLVKSEPPKVTEIEPPKMVKMEPPKLTKIEPPKVSKIPNKIEFSKPVRTEHSKVPEIEPSKLTKTEPSKLAKIEPPIITIIEASKVNGMELPKATNTESLNGTKTEKNNVTQDSTNYNWNQTSISSFSFKNDPERHAYNSSPTPLSSFSSKNDDKHQASDRSVKLPMVTFGKSIETTTTITTELPFPRTLLEDRGYATKKTDNILKEVRKPAPKHIQKHFSLPEPAALAKKTFNRQEKILKTFQTNWNTVKEILDDNSDVDIDEIENFKQNLHETRELVTDYEKMISELKSRKALSTTRHKLENLRTQLTCTRENVNKFKGLRRDDVYNEISGQLADYAAEIGRFPELPEEKQEFLKEVEQCLQFLEIKAIKHEQLLQELISQQVEIIGHHYGLVREV